MYENLLTAIFFNAVTFGTGCNSLMYDQGVRKSEMLQVMCFRRSITRSRFLNQNQPQGMAWQAVELQLLSYTWFTKNANLVLCIFIYIKIHISRLISYISLTCYIMYIIIRHTLCTSSYVTHYVHHHTSHIIYIIIRHTLCTSLYVTHYVHHHTSVSDVTHYVHHHTSHIMYTIIRHTNVS